jgi:hypothetical protein
VVNVPIINSSCFYSNPTKLPSLDEKISAKSVSQSDTTKFIKGTETGMISHKCSHCGKVATNEFELEDFPINRGCKDGHSTFCKDCFNKLYNARRMRFLGMQIVLPYNPRLGICQICGKTVEENGRQMSMHHDAYNPENVLDFTVEECNECHPRERFK